MSLLFSKSLLVPYVAPVWAAGLQVPAKRIPLAIAPTPLQRVPISASEFGIPESMELWVKRDDLTGVEMCGNKIRKLEFLLAEAIENGHDSVVTIGGIQSNHCRATAAAACRLGLECHMILRCPDDVANNPSTLGLTGNLLIDRLVNAKIHIVTVDEYRQYGQAKLVQRIADDLRSAGKNPFPVPVGGSTGLGSFGYLECVREWTEQSKGLNVNFDEVWCAAGSAGTLAGLALGTYLAFRNKKDGIEQPSIFGVGVCDTPEYFYDEVKNLISQMGFTENLRPEELKLHVIQGRGLGYSVSAEDELEFIVKFAQQTGVIFDPTYTGKGLFHLFKTIRADPKSFEGKKILFVHTGGIFGTFEKVDQLAHSPLLNTPGSVNRMKL